ncbi:hypothetical protein KCP76_07935 [Salmonella enterica subsp. enterica serovar Weltevreden]|nr:hypothetical protein KCP76_07935 [Salmonella enterica subsp. enterica serovar Weltevreden]
MAIAALIGPACLCRPDMRQRRHPAISAVIRRSRQADVRLICRRIVTLFCVIQE